MLGWGARSKFYSNTHEEFSPKISKFYTNADGRYSGVLKSLRSKYCLLHSSLTIVHTALTMGFFSIIFLGVIDDNELWLVDSILVTRTFVQFEIPNPRWPHTDINLGPWIWQSSSFRGPTSTHKVRILKRKRNQHILCLNLDFLVTGQMKISWYNPFKPPPAPPAFGAGKVLPEASSS